jgi:hypothetical protein
MVDTFIPPPPSPGSLHRSYHSEVYDKLGSVWWSIQYIAYNTLSSAAVISGILIYVHVKLHLLS